MLCRLKPGVPSGLVSTEPGPGGTISICFRGRQRRFCLDWVFPSDTTQEEVTLHSGWLQSPDPYPPIPFPSQSTRCPSVLLPSDCRAVNILLLGQEIKLRCLAGGFPTSTMALAHTPHPHTVPRGTLPWLKAGGTRTGEKGSGFPWTVRLAEQVPNSLLPPRPPAQVPSLSPFSYSHCSLLGNSSGCALLAQHQTIK